MNQLLNEAFASAKARGYLQRAQRRASTTVVPYQEPKCEVDIDAMSLSALGLTRGNENKQLTRQIGRVEPLQDHQRLVIPSALGMSVCSGGTQRCTGNAVLRARYLRATTLTYAQIAGFVDGEDTATGVCGMVDNIAEPVNHVRRTDWFEEAWYRDGDGRPVSPDKGVITMGAFSRILQFNCDVRDYGFLFMPEGTTTDTAWREIGALEENRLTVRLQPYSLDCIAALNYVPAGSFALSAWVRAYGVALGITPSYNSTELYFSATLPSENDASAVTTFKEGYGEPLVSIAINVISIFGFMHLNKDRTYRTGDANIERIGTSYIDALKTLTNQRLITQIKANKESIIKTAAHPFGLAQTYWLGKAAHKLKLLATPLMAKHDVTPPLVQRLMIVDRGATEWDEFPAGQKISQLHAQELNLIRNEIVRVKANAPAYSDFHSLYGCPNKSRISADAEAAVRSLLLIVYGFVMTTHVNKRGKKDGLALALCWKSVERDLRTVATTWKNAWERELDQSGGQSASTPISDDF